MLRKAVIEEVTQRISCIKINGGWAMHHASINVCTRHMILNSIKAKLLTQQAVYQVQKIQSRVNAQLDLRFSKEEWWENWNIVCTNVWINIKLSVTLSHTFAILQFKIYDFRNHIYTLCHIRLVYYIYSHHCEVLRELNEVVFFVNNTISFHVWQFQSLIQKCRQYDISYSVYYGHLKS